MIWHAAALAWADVILIGLPLSSHSLGRQLREGPVSRMAVYTSAVLSHVVLIVPTLAIDWLGGKAGIRLLVRTLPFPAILLWTLGTLGACVAAWAAMLIEARFRKRGSDRFIFGLLPRTGKEHAAFFGASLSAGFTEEYLLRGFCLALLAGVSGSMALAFVLTSISFGLAHWYQGAAGILRATLLGAILAVPVVATGSMIPSMIAHAATDMISGQWTLKILRSWGVATE